MDLIETNLAIFVAASLALIAIPGQDNLYILTRGISRGRRAALLSAWGVCTGLLIHTAFAAIGLSAILASSALAFSIVKYVGAAYLIYLGVRMLLSRESLDIPEERQGQALSLRKVFLQGVVSNALNPKVALFFLAFLPQFVNSSGGSGALQFLVLGLLFIALTLVITTFLAYFSGSLGEWLRGRQSVANVLGKAAGGILVGLGVRLALSGSR